MRKILIISILALVITISFAPKGFALYASTDPWPMYRYDVAHSGATPSDAPNSNRTLWTYGTSAGGGLSTASTPIIVDGRVIFHAFNWAYAVDETNGMELWKYSTSGWLTAPSYANGRVFFGLSDNAGGIVCINASTGVEIWNQPISPYYVKGTPLVNKGVVYAGSTGNNTLAFDAATGHYKWGYLTNGPIYSAPATHWDILFFGNDMGVLCALNVSGSIPVQKWNFTANGAIRSTPTIDSGRVFFGSENHTLYALNETTGGLIWSWTTTDTSVRIRNGVAVANNIVYVTPESTSGFTADMGKIYALRADVTPGNYTETDFEIRYWTKQFTGYLFHEPVYANGKIILTSASGDPGMLYALDADVGTTLWWRRINWGPSLGDVIVADGRIWFTAYWWDPGSYTLYCIGDDPFPPTTYHYTVKAGGQNFDVTMWTNSTITDFSTANLESNGTISFKAKGIGTTGMCNITIPMNMLDEDYSIIVDGILIDHAPPVNNSTHASLYFTYNTTLQHTIKIVGTTFVPEFQPITIAPIMAVILFTVILWKSKE
jgi:outer membrane protein assembly factor BamB